MKEFNKEFSNLVENIKTDIRKEFVEEFIQHLIWNKETKKFEIDLKYIEKYKTKEKEEINYKYYLDKLILSAVGGFLLAMVILYLLCKFKVPIC